jgi:hypothetical protein
MKKTVEAENATMVLEGKENKFIYFLIKIKCDSKIYKESATKSVSMTWTNQRECDKESVFESLTVAVLLREKMKPCVSAV